MYNKISISIYVGNIIFEHLFMYDLYINTKFDKGNPISNPLDNTYIFIYFCLVYTTLGPKIEPQHLRFIFLNFSIHILFIGTERMWYRTTTTSFHFSFFSLIPLLLGREGVGSNPHNPTLIFLLKFPLFCLEVMGSITTRLNLLFFF